ncbi:hypothetical protein FBR04_16320 [Betaproteobacteria bacterium PRO7]|nr:hypothetical protein [Betaproteobacteria bacterium PRO7]
MSSFVRRAREAMRVLPIAWHLVLAAKLMTAAAFGANAANVFTPHQFAVSESGAATLTVPIQVPRGTAGMEPQLSLTYSSQSGNGLLGLGWSLSGVSAITRCPQTLASDDVRGAVNFDQGDRWCLDGQRLIRTDADGIRQADQSTYAGAGAVIEYRTERDAFARIRAYHGAAVGPPDRFTVWTKGGQMIEYGWTDNSRIQTHFVNGRTNTISRWMAERISDRNGNFISFQYCSGQVDPTSNSCDELFRGSAVLHFVRYTNRNTTSPEGRFAVLFRYGPREDVIPTFHAGSRSVQTQRITHIETYLDWQGVANPGRLIRRYTLTYEPLQDASGRFIRATAASRLTRVQESVADANVLPLRPIDLQFSSDLVFGQSVAHVQAPPPPRPPGDIEGCGGVVRNGIRTLCP